MNEETRIYYEKMGQKYADFHEAKYLSFTSLFDEMSWLQFSEFLPKNKNAKILDAGCGGGGWSLRLAKNGYKNISLIDFSSSCIDGARRIFKKHNQLSSAKFYVCDLADLSQFSDGCFDFIFCERDPLEYCFDNQEDVFAELIRVLSDKGIITLSTGTSYQIKQKMLATKRFEAFFHIEKTGTYHSSEGWLKPLSRRAIENLFRAHNIQKLKIAGRLTITDSVTADMWEEIYQNPELKQKLLDIELKYQKIETLADYSSHIFAAGKKWVK